MTEEENTRAAPEQLPVAPGRTRDAALAELDRVKAVVAGLAKDAWSKPSAVPDWTVGDVVAHLNLAIGLYRRVIRLVRSGKGGGPVWKAFGDLTKLAAPAAAPAFHAVNRTLPKLIDRSLSREVIQGQFAAGARDFRRRLEQVEPLDYSRPVYYMGGPWPLSFFLAAVTNELAVHGWDVSSPLDRQAHLGAEAREILPSFYWSGTPFMLRLPETTTGTIQVNLTDPPTSLWWKLGPDRAQGAGQIDAPGLTISGEAGTFVLVLAGRIAAEDAFRSTSLSVLGDEAAAKTFLESWRLV